MRAFQPPLAGLGKSLALGVLVAAPLAIINNLYFYLNVGSILFENGLRSALEALSPAIHEEVIFRYFVLGIVFHLLGSSTSRRIALAVTLVLYECLIRRVAVLGRVFGMKTAPSTRTA